jgi:hypothetical protein
MTVLLELDSATEERIAHAANQAGLSIADYLLQMIGAQAQPQQFNSTEWIEQLKQFGSDSPTGLTLPLEATRRESIYED